MDVQSISPTDADGDSSSAMGTRAREERLTEHLQGLPHWLLVQYVLSGIGAAAILDTLHVLGDGG